MARSVGEAGYDASSFAAASVTPPDDLLLGMCRRRGVIPVEVRAFELFWPGRAISHERLPGLLGTKTKNPRNYGYQIARMVREILPDGYALVAEPGMGYRLLKPQSAAVSYAA